MNDTILAISGSSRRFSTNRMLLVHINQVIAHHKIEVYSGIHSLPLFSEARDHFPCPPAVMEWRKKMSETKALIICTPEYLHNLPASIKNALEWLASTGELYDKPVLPITFTPKAPRGKKAMQSLLWTLEALNARVVTQLDLYRTEILMADNEVPLMKEAESEMIAAALELLH